MKIWVTLFVSAFLYAQEAPQPAKPKMSSIIGEIKAKDASKLTVKTDAGESYTATLDERTSFVKVQPGEKDLSKASKIAFGDLNVGDRVMARGQVAEETKTIPARMIIVMTKSDLEQKQAKERAEWTTRGGAGVVDSVTADAVVITQKVRNENKQVTLAVGPNTRIRRYANDSIRFNDAKASTVAEIKKGDQLRVLGTKNEDGSKIAAEEIVYGTFRLIPATVISADPATGEIKVTDLDSKKPILVLATSDSQIKKLPEMMARMLAMQVNGTAANAAMQGMGGGFPGGARPGGAPGAAPAGGGQQAARPQGERPQGERAQWDHAQGSGSAHTEYAQSGASHTDHAPGERPQGAPGAPGAGGPGGPGGPPMRGGFPGGPGGPGGFGGGARGGDLSSVIERLPVIKLDELKPGDALIINSTAAAGSARVSAITILAGVEPILTSAPRSAGNINLGSWSLGGGAEGGGPAQ